MRNIVILRTVIPLLSFSFVLRPTVLFRVFTFFFWQVMKCELEIS
jgi:hypothetical protein